MQKLSKQNGGQSAKSNHRADLNKPMTFKEVAGMLAKSMVENTLKKKGIIPKYPLEMDLVPYSPKLKVHTFQSYAGKGFAYQHVVHFISQIGSMPDVDALKIRLFIGTLKGTAFDRYMQLPANSLPSWAALEEKFLLHFWEEDWPINLNSLCQTKHGENESVQAFINS